MAQYKVITALKTQAEADRAKALMSLELLTESNKQLISDYFERDFITFEYKH